MRQKAGEEPGNKASWNPEQKLGPFQACNLSARLGEVAVLDTWFVVEQTELEGYSLHCLLSPMKETTSRSYYCVSLS